MSYIYKICPSCKKGNLIPIKGYYMCYRCGVKFWFKEEVKEKK